MFLFIFKAVVAKMATSTSNEGIKYGSYNIFVDTLNNVD